MTLVHFADLIAHAPNSNVRQYQIASPLALLPTSGFGVTDPSSGESPVFDLQESGNKQPAALGHGKNGIEFAQKSLRSRLDRPGTNHNPHRTYKSCPPAKLAPLAVLAIGLKPLESRFVLKQSPRS